MGAATSTVTIDTSNVDICVISPDMLHNAVKNIKQTTAPINDSGARINQQTINNNVPAKTSQLFVDNFNYDPSKTLPEDIYSSDGKLKGSKSESYWYLNNDENSDKSVNSIVTAAVNALGDADLFPLDSKNRMVDAILTEIKGLFKFNYSVWVPDTDTFYGPVIKDDTGKKYRARIDLAYYAYHGKTEKNNEIVDGVYLHIKTASYVAKYSI